MKKINKVLNVELSKEKDYITQIVTRNSIGFDVTDWNKIESFRILGDFYNIQEEMFNFLSRSIKNAIEKFENPYKIFESIVTDVCQEQISGIKYFCCDTQRQSKDIEKLKNEISKANWLNSINKGRITYNLKEIKIYPGLPFLEAERESTYNISTFGKYNENFLIRMDEKIAEIIKIGAYTNKFYHFYGNFDKIKSKKALNYLVRLIKENGGINSLMELTRVIDCEIKSVCLDSLNIEESLRFTSSSKVLKKVENLDIRSNDWKAFKYNLMENTWSFQNRNFYLERNGIDVPRNIDDILKELKNIGNCFI